MTEIMQAILDNDDGSKKINAKTKTRRIALVTGAGRGIGRATALALAQTNHHVILLGRNEKNLETLYDDIVKIGSGATGAPMDVGDFPALYRLANIISARWGRLDVLVANAGQLGTITPTSHIKGDEFQALIKINTIANQQLIAAFEDLLLASKAGRAVFITSGIVQSLHPFFAAYAASKAALDAMVLTWAREQENAKQLKINLFNPGPVATKMRALAFPGEDPKTLTQPEELMPLLMKLCAPALKETGKLWHYREHHKKI